MSLPRCVRPNFLLGVVMGIALSSTFIQFFLVADDAAVESPHSRSERHLTEPTIAKRSIYGDYEVHNIGLQLKAKQEEEVNSGSMHPTVNSNSGFIYTDTYAQDDALLRELRVRRLVHVSILSVQSRSVAYASAIQRTWRSQLAATDIFLPTPPEDTIRLGQMPGSIKLPGVTEPEAFGFRHALHTLDYLCQHHLDDYQWFVMVHDVTYVHTSSLVQWLQRLSASSEVVIGREIPDMRGYCSIEQGVIISHSALAVMCPTIMRCDHRSLDGTCEEEDCKLSQCIRATTGMNCYSTNEISKDFHHTKDVSRPLRSLSDDVIFYGALSTPQEFYQVHLHHTERQIQLVQNEIYRLGHELSSGSQGIGNMKLPGDLNDELYVFGPEGSMKNASEPYYEFINDDGEVYLDTCKVQKQKMESFAEDGDGSYEKALNMAKVKVGPSVSGMKHFAYRITKPGIGIEFHFYFIDKVARKRKNGAKGRKPAQTEDKVYQVTVLLPYGHLQIDHKEIQVLRTIHFVVPVAETTNAADIENFLDVFETVCSNSSRIQNCSLLALFYQKVKKTHAAHHMPAHQKVNDIQMRMPAGSVKTMEVVGETYTFERTVQMADSAFPRDTLLAFVPPDTTFSADFLYRCQTNTAFGKRVYFPVVFQNLPRITATQFTDILDQNGFWANKHYDAFCVYNEDIQNYDSLPNSPSDLHKAFKEADMEVFRVYFDRVYFEHGQANCVVKVSHEIDKLASKISNMTISFKC